MPGQKGRVRSPKYPYIDLPSAINRLRQMHDFAKRSDVDFNTLVNKCWGYTPSSGSARKVFAALKTFGLIADTGKGDGRKGRITDLGLNIIHGTDDARIKSLQEAALKPKAYEDAWKKWGDDMPSDDVIKSYLILDKRFNDSSVDGLLADYKRTIEYARLAESANINDNEQEDVQVKAGDWIQWESQGILQFPESKQVTGFTDDKKFLYVSGSNTGIPVNEIEVVDAPERGGDKIPPPFIEANMLQDVLNLNNGEGKVIIQFPPKMSAENFEDLTDWILLKHRQIGRSVEVSETEKPKLQLEEKNEKKKAL